ncbi:GxGYxYP domain-containing protein [Flavivirga spongiicola]|uniref:GxGYxYP family putative glycoside hydrolase n=1 Tax=Flavivirga spongiicola TaxID=421621 RepID=A0ABU7XSR4_9FLAO|nr:GxGYxYP domain-containing protein [Flavivirga sp. MEBiC05379]MDO5977897.1 GxGYxYP family putative glycoside hydrolase [Flavivirga sp. MEBiC05379]
MIKKKCQSLKKEDYVSIPILSIIGILFMLFVGLGCSKDNPIDDNQEPDPPVVNINDDIEVTPKTFTVDEEYWWPNQNKAKKLIICNLYPEAYDERVLAESLAGIAAWAVNEGLNDEMVWIEAFHGSYPIWLDKLKARQGFTEVIRLTLWDIVRRFNDKGLIPGYISYKADNSTGNSYDDRAGRNESANFATSAAAVLKGIIVEKKLKDKAEKLGIKMIYDANKENYLTHYRRLKPALNKNLILMSDPAYPNQRGMAIAHNAGSFYGLGTPLEVFLADLNPISPVLGWNFGGEHTYTEEASINGLFTTATNWCWNMTVTSAGAHEYQPKKVKTVSHENIDFDKEGSFHSFIMSDGDNIQWLSGSFFHHTDYWANENHGDFPMGWTTCVSNLSETYPDAIDYLSDTQPTQTSVIEYGGGYHYPDMFGKLRGGSEPMLRKFAKKINLHLKKTGANIFGFITRDLHSAEAKLAFQVYAEELDIIGMIVNDFSPYESGNGEIYWATNKEGKHIPIISSKYSLWNGTNFERSGDPTKISGLINSESNQAIQQGASAMSWTNVHAWSTFEENGVQARGLTPVKWTIDKLDSNVNVVSPEELIWRIRKLHYPSEVN